MDFLRRYLPLSGVSMATWSLPTTRRVARFSAVQTGTVLRHSSFLEMQMESEDEHTLRRTTRLLCAACRSRSCVVRVLFESTRSDGRIQCNSNVDVNSRPREMTPEALEDLVR